MSRPPAIALAPGVWRIPFARDWLNGFLIRDDDGSVTLVDLGLKRSPPKVAAALRHVGSSPSDVVRIVLTHAHPDHAGGAAEVAARTGRQVDVHAADAGYLRRGEVPPRDDSQPLGRLLNRMPGGVFAPTAVGQELADGDVLPVAGGLTVVHTPGHSPGHVSLLHERSGVLITGDALFNVRGVGWSLGFFCTDFRLSQRTAHRLADLDYSVAAFTHGPEIRDGAREAVRGFLARPGVTGPD